MHRLIATVEATTGASATVVRAERPTTGVDRARARLSERKHLHLVAALLPDGGATSWEGYTFE